MCNDGILSFILSGFIILFMFLCIANVGNMRQLFLGLQLGILLSQFALLFKILLER